MSGFVFALLDYIKTARPDLLPYVLYWARNLLPDTSELETLLRSMSLPDVPFYVKNPEETHRKVMGGVVGALAPESSLDFARFLTDLTVRPARVDEPEGSVFALARRVEWALGCAWRVRFNIINDGSDYGVRLSLPEHFRGWIPASEIQENLATSTSFEWDAGNTNWKIPSSSTAFTVTITTYDDVELSLHEFLSTWVNGLLLGGNGKAKGALTPLKDCVQELVVEKLRPAYRKEARGQLLRTKRWSPMEVVKTTRYYVYPEVEQYYRGGSGPEPVQVEMNLVIVGS